MLYNIKTTYICNVFFMVLDLRLMKIGCRETANFFLPSIQTQQDTRFYPKISEKIIYNILPVNQQTLLFVKND